MTRTAALRQLLSEPGAVIMPGVYDALSARLAERAGFGVVNVGGAMVANSILGLPDVGLATMTEVAEQIRRVTAATTIPAIADADTGHGNEINVMRMVREFSAAGAAGIYMEDQVFPKRCGHFAGKDVIPMGEMVTKVSAAADAREDDDFLIIARTDSRAVYDFDTAVERSNAYVDAGADMIFLEAPQSIDEWRKIPELVNAPVMANMITGGGKSPALSARELEEIGFKLINFGAASQQAAMFAVARLYEELKRTGTTEGCLDWVMTFNERQEVVGLPEVEELEAKYSAVRARVTDDAD